MGLARYQWVWFSSGKSQRSCELHVIWSIALGIAMVRAMATCASVSSDSDLEAFSGGTLPSQRHFDVHAVRRALDVSESDDEGDADSAEPMLSPSGSISDTESETVIWFFNCLHHNYIMI